jgi:hypothetical protein
MGVATAISNASLCGALATAGRPGTSGFAEETARCWHIRLSDKLSLGRFGAPTVPQTHSRASAVFVDELDAGGFQGAANG